MRRFRPTERRSRTSAPCVDPSSAPCISPRPSGITRRRVWPRSLPSSSRKAGRSMYQPTDDLVIAGKSFRSRLMLGSGKYRDFAIMRDAIEASGTQIVTVAIRRVELGAPGHVGVLDAIDRDKIQLLPNTAGCKTVDEA